MLPVSAGQRPAHRTFSGGGAGRSSGAGGMGHGPLSMDGSTSFPEYVRRIVDWKQMDLDATVDQMIMLLSRNPGRIYKRAYYRKQTKNQWARDDPGFVVLQVLFLLLAAVAWAAVFRSHGFWGYVGLMAHAVLLHWLLFGVIAATLGQSIANTHLLAARSHSVEQRVEWLYAFDIHCNAFFTLFVILYGVQFFLLPVLLGKSVLCLIVSNMLYALGFSSYFYISHLGYRSLPFLCNTELYLYPITLIVVLLVVSIVLAPFGFRLNMTRLIAFVYFGRQ